MQSAGEHEILRSVLERSRAFGFLGEGSVEAQIAHAECFVERLPESGSLLDLGSGGGVPGLIIAVMRPRQPLVLLDANARRCAFLRWASTRLGCDHVVVHEQRAEVAGRSHLRGHISCVTARSFGPPAITVECAAPLLAAGGRLLVSEPAHLTGADVTARWPAAGLLRVGLRMTTRTEFDVATIQEFELVSAVEPALPRPSRRMAKSPLF